MGRNGLSFAPGVGQNLSQVWRFKERRARSKERSSGTVAPGARPRKGQLRIARETAKALKSATGVIRSEVGRLIGLRHTPSLEFIADALPENAQRIDELVAAARQKDEELARASEGAQWAGDPDPYKKPADDDWDEDADDDWDEDEDA